MTTHDGRAVAFDAYWAAVDSEVRAQATEKVPLEELKIRSNESSTVYAARFTGAGGYPLLAYYSVPKGSSPFPALFEAPGYGSVRGVPAVERRAKYVVMGVCHRGQRLSDGVYKSAYPGLLTEGLPGAATYRWRDVVADCLRAFDVMAARPEVDKSRIGIAGNDLAALVAGVRPHVKCLLLNGQLLFRDTSARLTAAMNYPLDEFADFRRAHPTQWDEATKTLALYDPIAFAPAITAETLIACLKGDAAVAEPLARAIKSKCEMRVNSGKGFLDHEHQEEWLAQRLLK
jgi:cephalosporin-C deacetylase-like acetyl esterase